MMGTNEGVVIFLCRSYRAIIWDHSAQLSRALIGCNILLVLAVKIMMSETSHLAIIMLKILQSLN